MEDRGWRGGVFAILDPRSSILSRPLSPLMMVGDDQIDAALAGDLGLFNRSDAAIDADDQAGALVADLRDRLGVEAVALVDAVRDVEVGGPAEHADRVPE